VRTSDSAAPPVDDDVDRRRVGISFSYGDQKALAVRRSDVTGLHGLRNTAPYFHNNSAATLEEVVDHYTEVFKRAKVIAPPGVVPPLLSTDGVHFDRPFVPKERAALLAYLRKL
jgi:cytochrome c peroxidase